MLEVLLGAKKTATMLTPIMSPLPFAKCSMNIFGPVPKATRQMKYLLVVIDYFTKWVETKVMASITRLKSASSYGRT